MRRLHATEGAPLHLDTRTAQAVDEALKRLTKQLRPTISFAGESRGRRTVRNLIGTVQLGPSLVLEVAPKTRPETDWVGAVLALLDDARLGVSDGDARARRTRDRDLAGALARVYADRLEKALRSEGPLLTLRTRSHAPSRLSGRLDVTAWTRNSILKPHRFPQTDSVLDADNDFTAAMTAVALRLARLTTSAPVSGRLKRLATDLRPGLPEALPADVSVVHRPLPPQWRDYAPAWSITTAVLSQTSLLHRSGALHGVEIAIEAWPLLERLLQRSLDAAVLKAHEDGLALVVGDKKAHPILVPELSSERPGEPLTRLHQDGGVVPDGILCTDDGRVAATLEAKYSQPRMYTDMREHAYQALSTAAALGSPLAVLAYPEPSGPVRWRVTGFQDRPRELVAVGLDLFGYEPGIGDRDRGNMLLEVIKGEGSTA